MKRAIDLIGAFGAGVATNGFLSGAIFGMCGTPGWVWLGYGWCVAGWMLCRLVLLPQLSREGERTSRLRSRQ